jgi:adenine-specific DNA-methyltransferase
MTVSEIRNILESPYDRKVWKNFLQTQFTNNKLNAEDRTISISDKTLSKKCLSLGNYEINEYTKIGIFEIELTQKGSNITRSRIKLRNLIKELTKQVAGAMVVFVQGDKWRFSYISKRKVKNKETNLIEDKETAPKRYTYLFGKGEKALTAAQRFDRLIEKQKANLFDLLSLDDFEDAFSVEKLSKEFFANYKNAYEDFVQFLTGKRYAKKGSKYAEQVVSEPNWQLTALFGKDEKQARDFVKRMMGRIVFLYFIQKKGWLSVKQSKKWGEGNPDYLYDLFKKSKQKDDFYARELVPLFFTRLNNEDSENLAREERFPYLNGGLFDDTQDRKYNKLHLPEDVFEKMFDTFNNYNFTIYEDAPDEHTVAVDPEMLGHIFENLLEDNKDKGAFYTPKEIVHYMCKESLKAFLFAQDEKQYADALAKATIDKIIQQQELNGEETTFAEKNAYKIIDALDNVKICDPAIGSGAFPMGLLQEIFNAQIYLQELKGFKKAKTDADIKKHIIEESIYGVDIDAGAVDIARLRFWLSLVVDEQEPQPLPNLDFKIICANTLIPLGKLNGLDMDAKASIAVKELEKIRHDFFDVSSEEKLKLERQFKKVQTDLLSLRELATKDNFEFYTKLYEFSPFDYESAPCSWFDAAWMFGVKDGFDIVIGNPPYLGISKLSYKKELNKIGYQTFESTGDLYSVFYERGNQLLKEKGILTFITSRQWINASYGKSLRQYFVEKSNPLQLIDFGKAKIFEAATVFVNILMFENAVNKKELKACQLQEDFKVENNDLGEYFDSHCSILNNLTESVWKIGEEEIELINNEIEKNGTPLKDWKGLEFYRGITTGLNGAFHISKKERQDFVNEDSKNAEIIKPLLRGKDIKKYCYEFNETYTLFIPWHFPLQDNPNINSASDKAELAFKNDYPAVYKHLSKFKTELSDRNKDETGIRYEWYAMQRYGANYWQEFEKEKIVWIEISDKANYSYDTKGMYLTNSAYFISGSNLKYILAVLNSNVADFYFFQITAKIAGGRKRYTKQYVEQIPIPIINNKRQIPFIILIDYLLYANDKENRPILSHTDNLRLASHLEEVLNMMVYELYFEKHMKENGIDVLQFINPKPIADLKKEEVKAEVIKDFYLWYQKPENPVRQRMLLLETRSKDKIALINKSIQL